MKVAKSVHKVNKSNHSHFKNQSAQLSAIIDLPIHQAILKVAKEKAQGKLSSAAIYMVLLEI